MTFATGGVPHAGSWQGRPWGESETFNLMSLRTDPQWAAGHKKRASSLYSQALRAVLCLQLPPPLTEQGLKGEPITVLSTGTARRSWLSLPGHSAGGEPLGPPSKQRTWDPQGGSFLEVGGPAPRHLGIRRGAKENLTFLFLGFRNQAM